jgi:tetratricopeptide (TPR) repeat protein
VQAGKAKYECNAIPEAVGYFYRALAIVHRHPYAVIELQKVANLYAAAGEAAWAQGDTDRALAFTVAAIEADPNSPKPKELLVTIDHSQPRLDTTRHCYVFYDAQRDYAMRGEAIRRTLEYTAISGVIGDVMEFGVLAGWTSRIFAETMRDMMVMGNLHLYDSFEGLPNYNSPVDQASYEIAGRNIWSDKMKFSDDFVASLGGSIERQIESNLAYVIRRERIMLHRGFYSDTLKESPHTKAALVHIDCDLYQSTVDVLWGLYRHDVFQDGCALMFDDWNCNKASPYFGERRAFQEFLEGQECFTASEFFTYGFNGAVFILHEVVSGIQ